LLALHLKKLNRISELEAENAELKNRKSSLKAHNDSANEIIAVLRKENAELEAETAELKQKLKELEWVSKQDRIQESDCRMRLLEELLDQSLENVNAFDPKCPLASMIENVLSKRWPHSLALLPDLRMENIELKKRLECPAVIWNDDGKAFSGDFQIGYAKNGIWIFAFDDCSMHTTNGNNERQKLESAWREFWEKTTGGAR